MCTIYISIYKNFIKYNTEILIHLLLTHNYSIIYRNIHKINTQTILLLHFYFYL